MVARALCNRVMLALEKWAEGKPPLWVMVAHQIAIGAEACYEACVLARSRGPVGGAAMPGVDQWYRLFRRHRRVMAVALKALLPDGPERALSEELGGVAQGIGAMRGVKPEEMRAEMEKTLQGDREKLLREVQAYGEGLYRLHLESIRREIAEGKEGSIPEIKPEAVPEVLFFLRVTFPCWIAYGRPVGRLLREARSGQNLQAVEDLLRLDKAAIEDPRVRQYFHAAVNEGRPGVVQRLNTALAGEPLRRLTLPKVKVSLAALVYRIFADADSMLRAAGRAMGMAGMNMKLTAPEVRRLFDAVARDYKGELRDEDLPAVDHTFYMALKRELPFWPGLSRVSQK